MAGSLAGALHGIGAVPLGLYETVKSVNSEDMEALAAGLTEIAWRRVNSPPTAKGHEES
jgi:hypothetical protein